MFVGLIGFIGFIAFIVFGIMWIISLVKKNGKALRNFLISAAGLVVLIIVSVIGVGSAVNEVMKDIDEGDLNEITDDLDNNNEINEDVNDNKENVAVDNNNEEEENNDDVPREYKSALNKAESYANNMDMSKNAVREQLVSEHGEAFPEEAADYAMDHVEADWKENALNKARTYADEMDMSNDAIYEQLVSEHGEGFTEDQAQYAMDNLE